MSLYNKYRPRTFDQVVGNRETVAALRQVLEKADPPHSFLFIGPTGCGKTTLARLAAKELGIAGEDFAEVDSADFRGIDTVRDIRRLAAYKGIYGGRRGWLLDEVHQMTKDAQNALLKALEDPPEHVFYFLATTDPDKLIAPLRGRCLTFQVAPLDEERMFRLLFRICRAEGESPDKELLLRIASKAEGRPRNAIQLLERVLSLPEEQRGEALLEEDASEAQVAELCRLLLKGASWMSVKKVLGGLKGQDPESIRRSVLGYCTSVLLSQENDRAAAVLEAFGTPTYDTGFSGLVFAAYSVVRGVT